MIRTQEVDLYFGLKWMAYRDPEAPILATGLGRTEAEAIAELEAQEAHTHVWSATKHGGIEQCSCGACRFTEG